MIEDCDFDAGILMVKNKTARSTGVKKRKVWLSPRLKGLIEHLTIGRPEGHIWLNCRGGPWAVDTLIRQMYLIRLQLGLRKGISLYGYRHRWGSDAINEKGINPALVALQMGHQDLNMLLKHYLHSDDRAMQEAVNQATLPKAT
jgi:integrase